MRKIFQTIIRAIRRLSIIVAALLAIGVVLSVIGVAVIWGHFWDWRVGDPTSKSCASCHVIEPYVESMTTADLLGSAHAMRDVTCTDCHDYGLDHQIRDTVAYLRNEYEEPLPQESYDMDMCFQCHEHGSYDQIAWRTMDLGVTDGQAKGHSANPHASPHYTELECNLCHRVHEPSTLYCWECHTYDFGNPMFQRSEAPPDASSEADVPVDALSDEPSAATPETTPKASAEATPGD